jgi:hypothetical protein
MTITPEKSSVTLFTPWNREVKYHPKVFIGDTLIPLVTKVKHLGYNFNPLFTPTTNIGCSGDKCTSRLQIMKALKGQDFGDKETLCMTYKALIKPVMIFNGPIWYLRV